MFAQILISYDYNYFLFKYLYQKWFYLVSHSKNYTFVTQNSPQTCEMKIIEDALKI